MNGNTGSWGLHMGCYRYEVEFLLVVVSSIYVYIFIYVECPAPYARIRSRNHTVLHNSEFSLNSKAANQARAPAAHRASALSPTP